MKLSPIFQLSEKASPALVSLLESVTLGTNGAHYRHLNTPERIQEADNPLHLSMGRNNRIIGNVSFCRRGNTWYVRYFAFNRFLQSGGSVKSKGNSGRLKTELSSFFDYVISEKQPYGDVRSFYAYIDPNNEKSLWMSEYFGFKAIADIATQTFSRVRLPKETRVEKTNDWNAVSEVIRQKFSEYQYYFEAQLSKGSYYVLWSNSGEILACAKVTKAAWLIEQLPGRNGKWLPRVIPYLPGIRRIINPKNHSFVVPEAVFVKDNDSNYLNQLFEGILTHEKEHLILWWVDEKEPLYVDVKDEISWGLLDKMIGVNYANFVVKHNDSYQPDYSTPVYTCGFDFV